MSFCDMFEEIALERRGEYKEVIEVCPELTSDYSFVNLFGWGPHYGLKWCFNHGLVWIKQSAGADVFWAPVGDWAGVDWAALPCMEKSMRFTRVPEALVVIWKKAFGDRVKATEVRDHFDYVYSVPELVELGGSKFHKKKNLLRQFEKNYVFEYAPICPHCVDEVLAMQSEWLGWQECPSEALMAENEAISRVMKNFGSMCCLMGGSISIDGKVVAYTVGECLGKDTVLIHFEKGNTRYKGIYQAINQYFLNANKDRFAFVNREQDLGDEGLRKAKLSYNPVRFMQKYEVELL